MGLAASVLPSPCLARLLQASLLVARINQMDKYRCLRLMRAVAVVKCQSALVICTAVLLPGGDFVDEVCLSEMRRSRHWDDRTPSSDPARSGRLPRVMPSIYIAALETSASVAYRVRKQLAEEGS
jgi:hypothetical protein